MGYPPIVFEHALGRLWELVEARLTDEEKAVLTNPALTPVNQLIADVFGELIEFGPNGPVGIGIGRIGGHAVGDED